jgi:hypothetical protein
MYERLEGTSDASAGDDNDDGGEDDAGDDMAEAAAAAAAVLAPAAAASDGASAALAEMTCRAEEAEAEQRRLAARVAELEHEARGAALGKRSAETREAALHDIVGVKRERLESATAVATTATAAAATATAAATRAADALDDAITCRVCFEAPRQMVFLLCFHLAVFAGCSNELCSRAADQLSVAARRKGTPAAKPLCPVCRTHADSIVGPIFQA